MMMVVMMMVEAGGMMMIVVVMMAVMREWEQPDILQKMLEHFSELLLVNPETVLESHTDRCKHTNAGAGLRLSCHKILCIM
jgi:hypothetical protein